MNTASALAKLKEMAKRAGEGIFERAKLASQVLADDQWIVNACHGNRDEAIELLEKEYFPELSTVFSLDKLVTLYEKFQNIDDWIHHKFNLNALWGTYLATLPKEPVPQGGIRKWPIPNKIHNEALEKIRELEYKVKKSDESFQNQSDRIRNLEEENRKLREENAELRGRVKQLERMMMRNRELEPV